MAESAGMFYVGTLLQKSGWPRSKGISRKKVVNSELLDITIDNMIDWAASLGTGRPELAVQLLIYSTPGGGWGTVDSPDLNVMIRESKTQFKKLNVNSEDAAPHNLFAATKFTRNGEYTTWAMLNNEIILKAMRMYFIDGLLYGLGNPDKYEGWYKFDTLKRKKNKKQYSKLGINIQDIPTNPTDLYKYSESIARDYIKSRNITLPTIPQEIHNSLEGLFQSR